MAIEITLPELGENISSADIVNVLIKQGDIVERDQSIIEIETDKATIEVPATAGGVVKEVKVKAGDKMAVGGVIAIIEDAAAEVEQPVKAESSVKAEVEVPVVSKVNDVKKEEAVEPIQSTGGEVIKEITLPELGENIASASVINVLVNKGDVVERDQSLMEIETDKATIEVPSVFAGEVVEVLVKAGEDAKVGQILFKIKTAGTVSAPKAAAKPEAVKEEKAVEQTAPKQEVKEKEPVGTREKLEPGELEKQPPVLKGQAPAAPSVRRIAREIGVDINEVKGTGPGGRISMDDVKLHSKKKHEEYSKLKNSPSFAGVKKESLPDFTKFGETEVKEMSKIRYKTAEHLSYAWAVIPHVTQNDKADITYLEQVRKKLSAQVEKSGAKLTMTSILVKIIVEALKKYPQFNSSINLENQKIIYKKYFNIGIAVDTEHGLIVPVIKDADKKNLTEISVEINKLAEKARSKKIGLDDMQGGCFTITNLGGIGGTSFTPIVNSPEVAILGVSRGNIEPVYVQGEFQPRLMLPLSLSYDHRIIDGADAARYLRFICETLEQPLNLLL